MGAIKDAANQAFRDFNTDGVPASGVKRPEKGEIRDVFEVVDEAVGALVDGVAWSPQTIRVRSTGNVNIANGLENGDTLNGVTLATGDHVFLGLQTDKKQNGIYTVVAAGAASRATFADSAAELTHIGFLIQAGTAGAGERWTLPLDAEDITLGTTDLEFAQIGIESDVTAIAADLAAETAARSAADVTLAAADTTEAATRLAQDTLAVNAGRDSRLLSGAIMTRYSRTAFGAAGVNGRPASATATYNRTMTFMDELTGAVLSSGTVYTHNSAAPKVVSAWKAVDTTDDIQIVITGAALIDDLECFQRVFLVQTDVAAPNFRGQLANLMTPFSETLSTASIPYNADIRALGRSRVWEVLSLGSDGLFGSVSVFEGVTTLRRLLLGPNPLLEGDIGKAIASAAAFERLNVDGCPLLTLASVNDIPIGDAFTQINLNSCTGLGLDDYTKGLAFANRLIQAEFLNSIQLQNLGLLGNALDAILIGVRANADANAINAGTLNITGNAGRSPASNAAVAALEAAPRLWNVQGD